MPVIPHSNTNEILDYKIWRYMSLDKFIDLLESKTLYFTKLEDYRKSDPFEGYQPKIVVENLAKILKMRHQKFVNSIGHLADNPEVKQSLSDLNLCYESTYKILCKNIMVNCWHLNNDESEAMWKLYSENQKGVCIQSTVNNLIHSFSNQSDKINIKIGKVTYIDFFDDNLEINSCMIDNDPLTPLFKRTSYSHENELRAYITPNNDDNVQENNIPIDTKKLIDNIYISPFANNLFYSIVRTISRLYGIEDDKIIKSKLLEGDGKLLDLFKI